MTATTIERMTEFFGLLPARGTYPIAANTKLLKGTLVGLDSAGRAIAATLAATCVRVVGKASSTVNNLTGSELGGAAAAADVEVEFGTFDWANSADADEIAADDVGKLCYAVDNQTVALTSDGGTRQIAGMITGFYNSKPQIFTHPLVPVFHDVLTDLASTANAKGASLIGIEDAATNFAATDVEAALAEIIADYAATTASNGASKIGIQDAGGHTSVTTVEAAIQELYAKVGKRSLTVTEADLTDADGSQTVNLGDALPANARILGVHMHTLTPFSGGAVGDFTCDVGSANDPDALVDGADLFSAAVDGCPATITAGVHPNKLFADSTQLTATFICGSDDVADATAGAVTIDVLYAVLA